MRGGTLLPSRVEATLQAIGWRTEKDNRRYRLPQDDFASVACRPAALFPALPDWDCLEIV